MDDPADVVDSDFDDVSIVPVDAVPTRQLLAADESGSVACEQIKTASVCPHSELGVVLASHVDSRGSDRTIACPRLPRRPCGGVASVRDDFKA